MKASRPMLGGLAGGGNLVKAKKDMASEFRRAEKVVYWKPRTQFLGGGHEQFDPTLRMDGAER